jgi:hypothetical protein
MSDNRLNRITRLAVEAQPGPVRNYLVANLFAAATAGLVLLGWTLVTQVAHAQVPERAIEVAAAITNASPLER